MDTAKRLAVRTWRHFMQDSLYRNSIYLMGNSLVLSLFGFLFWTFAARVYTPEDVGISSTVISAATLIAALSFFGFDYALIKFLPNSDTAHTRTHTALSVAALSAVLAGCVYLALVPTLVPELAFLTASAVWVGIFILFMVLTVWNTLTNSVFIAFRITQYTLLASICFAVLRLPLLYLLADQGKNGIIAAQVIALFISVCLGFLFLFKSLRYRYRPFISRLELKIMGRYTFGTYLSNVTGGLPPQILPIIIIHVLTAEAAAYYYMALLLVTILNIIPTVTSQSLFAEGAWDKAALRQQLAKAARIISVLLAPAVIGMICLGWFLLSVFGKEYAEAGYWTLFFLCLTAIPKVASYLFSTTLRIHDKIRPIIIVATIGAVVSLTGSFLGLRTMHSITAVGIATLVSEIIVASLYAYLVLVQYRLLTSQER